MRLPHGFSAAAVAAGIKPSGRSDLGLLVSDRDASVAGLFTKNRVQAAPVVRSKRIVRGGVARAVVVNAGNANACTGAQGLEVAAGMQAATGRALGVPANRVLVASTGIIGVPMVLGPVVEGIERATGGLGGSVTGLSEAIMTTDTRPKRATRTIGSARIVGIAKGAGMIAPEMATLLAFVVTDVKIDAATLQTMITRINPRAFDRISVDGCMSTNDTLLVLANGAAGRVPTRAFEDALAEVLSGLADQVVADGEGATKIVDIVVRGARTERMARACARSVADSVLFRCAVHGGDPNWGRIVSALGASGQPIKADRIAVTIGGEALCVDGARGPGRLAVAERALQRKRIVVEIDLGLGSATATATTNDLSAEYVRINAEYTT